MEWLGGGIQFVVEFGKVGKQNEDKEQNNEIIIV